MSAGITYCCIKCGTQYDEELWAKECSEKHFPTVPAGVAQSGEHTPRKSEDEGSTPSSSSRYVLNADGLPVCDKCNYSIFRHDSNSTGWSHSITGKDVPKGCCMLSPKPKMELITIAEEERMKSFTEQQYTTIKTVASMKATIENLQGSLIKAEANLQGHKSSWEREEKQIKEEIERTRYKIRAYKIDLNSKEKYMLKLLADHLVAKETPETEEPIPEESKIEPEMESENIGREE